MIFSTLYDTRIVTLHGVCETMKVGHYIQASFTWDGINQTTVFDNLGRSDVWYASDPEIRRSVSGGTVF
jgi:hypothetical protein